MKLQSLHRIIALASIMLTATLASYGSPAASQTASAASYTAPAASQAAFQTHTSYQDHVQLASEGGGFTITILGFLRRSKDDNLSVTSRRIARSHAKGVRAQGCAVVKVDRQTYFQLLRVAHKKWALKGLVSGQIG